MTEVPPSWNLHLLDILASWMWPLLALDVAHAVARIPHLMAALQMSKDSGRSPAVCSRLGLGSGEICS